MKRVLMRHICGLFFLFLGLCLLPAARAQAGATLLIRTDMSCNWKLDGQPMTPLKADTSTIVLVSSGQHLIEAFATEGPATSRTEIDVDKVEKVVDLKLKSQNTQPPPLPATAGERNGAAPASTWVDPATSLMWMGRDNGSNVDWDQATEYCSTLRLAGYKDWRLPTIAELQDIYDPSVSVPQRFGDGLTSDVHVMGNLKITGWTWSSTQGDHAGSPAERKTLFKFSTAPLSRIGMIPQQNFRHFNYIMRALCVRVAGAQTRLR